jgi:iron complex outermembrane receptor protein
MKRTAILSASLFAALTAAAQKDTIELAPVEVQATRAGARAPFSKTNIGRGQIEKANLGQDLPFLLNTTPSVVVNSDAGNGVGYTGIRIRGTDASRINVTLNGVPFNDPESSGAFFVDLPDLLSSTSSIQIQRGVGTSSNGPAAFGATINLSTIELNEKSYLELNNSAGSFNTWKNTVRFGTGRLGKHFTFDGRLSRISSDGYMDRSKSNLKSWYGSMAWLGEKSSLRFNAFTGYEKTYQAWYGVTDDDLLHNRTINYAGTERPGSPYPNETDNYTQSHYQLFYNLRPNARWTLHTGLFYIRGKGYYEQYKAGQTFADYGMPDPMVNNIYVSTSDLVRQLWLDNHFYGATFSTTHTLQRTTLTFGGQLSEYKGRHYGEVIWAEQGGFHSAHRYYELPVRKSDANFYGKWEQSLTPAFTSYVDLQVRGVHYEINGFKDNPSLLIAKDYSFFNPKLGVHFRQGFWKGFLSFGMAHKEPNRDDFEAGKNEMPRPEKLQDLEFQLGQARAKSSWSVTFYYMHYRDQLVLTGRINDVGSYTRTNIPRSYRAGVEVEGAIEMKRWLKASANLTVSHNRILHFSEYIDDYDNGGQKVNDYGSSDIAFSPNLVGSATFTVMPLKNLDVDLIGKYVGDQFLDNTGNGSRKLDAYYDQSLRLTYRFACHCLKNLQLTGQVNNLFNAQYEPNGYTYSYISGGSQTTSNYYFPMSGTNWMLGINLRF